MASAIEYFLFFFSFVAAIIFQSVCGDCGTHNYFVDKLQALY